MARTHSLVGGSTGFILGTAAGLPLAMGAAVAAVAAVASSLPDTLEGPPRWLTKRAPWLARIWPRLPHRTVTHWPSLQLLVISLATAGVIVLSSLPDAFVILFAGAVAVGCVMHSIADAATVHPQGIQLLWPLSSRGYHVVPRAMRVWVGTNSRSEWAFSAVWCAFVLSYVYARYRHHISA